MTDDRKTYPPQRQEGQSLRSWLKESETWWIVETGRPGAIFPPGECAGYAAAYRTVLLQLTDDE